MPQLPQTIVEMRLNQGFVDKMQCCWRNSLGSGSAVGGGGGRVEDKKRGQIGKNQIGERSEPNGTLGREKERRNLETCL